MSCILHIIGKKFNPDDFIKKSKIRPYKVIQKGQPKFKSKPDGEKISFSGLSIQTSKASFNNLPGQIRDTISYLKRNKQKLKYIAKTKEIQFATLDFGVDLRIDRINQLTQSEYFPNKLIKIAGELGLGIELSIYPVDLQDILEARINKKKSK